MMNYIWAGMIIISIFAAIAKGNMQELSNALMNGGIDAINLCIRMLGMLCLWGGLMRIADKSGLAEIMSKIIMPVLKPIFPRLKKDSPAAKAISMNISVNLLGIGGAATPLGLEAMRKLQEENQNKTVATDDMIKFVVLNSAALRIIPTTVAMFRQQYGAYSPMDIMPAAWLTSASALFVGITLTKVIEKIFKTKNINIKGIKFHKRGEIK